MIAARISPARFIAAVLFPMFVAGVLLLFGVIKGDVVTLPLALDVAAIGAAMAELLPSLVVTMVTVDVLVPALEAEIETALAELPL